MFIEEIKLKSKNNTNIFVVSTDKGVFDLHSDIIVKYGIVKGEFEQEKFFAAKQESDELVAINVAMKYLSNKVKTEKQIKDYLYKKEFTKPIVESVLTKLKEYKVVDDKTYAEMYLRSNPNFSKRKAEQKLSSLGIKKELSNSLINDIDDYQSCLNNAQKFMRNKVMDNKTKEKLVRRLMYLGYNWDVIKNVLNNFNIEIEE
ncbi:MAG: RecX family transcriptional regulator [Clostridia bacterium]|nr:RecX family transcriptional regulator [Clostridia bacterium]